MAAALLLAGYDLWDERRAAVSAVETLAVLEDLCPEAPAAPEPADPGEREIPDYALDPERDMPAAEVKGEDYIGTLAIPCLGRELPVMENWSYPKLRTAPCRYSGSVYRDDMIVAAHNYQAHFGRLKDLTPGDGILFTDTEGNVFRYAVTEVEILNRYAVEEMAEGNWDLTLFTCTYGGKSRVTVRCRRL